MSSKDGVTKAENPIGWWLCTSITYKNNSSLHPGAPEQSAPHNFHLEVDHLLQGVSGSMFDRKLVS